jgi:hypothetical protein
VRSRRSGVARRPILELGAGADCDGQKVARFVDVEPVPPVAGHDRGLAGEQLDQVVRRVWLGRAEIEADRAAQAAHNLVCKRVPLPVIGVDVIVGLGVEDRTPPIGIAVCHHPAFVSADGLTGLEAEVVGEQVDDRGARGHA